MRPVLTIAGFDPSSGAGITADLMVFAAHGLFGTSCITGLTVQSTLGVRASYPVDPRTIVETLACLDDDLPPAGIKIGMLGTREAVSSVCDYLERLRGAGSEIPVVVDPVIRASSGRELLEPGGTDLLRARLLPLADWVTPNRSELEWLTALPGVPSKDRASSGEIATAAKVLHEQIAAKGGRRVNVLTTGGEMIPPDDFLLTTDGQAFWIPGEHVETTSTHGTGCALSSALLSRLVLGDDPLTATCAAKSYVTEALRTASPLGQGHGPMNHLWPLRRT